VTPARCWLRRRGQPRRRRVRCEHSSTARRKKHGAGVAAVATARKLAVMIWHVLTTGKDYAYARPAFTAMKLRKVALKAGAPRAYGKAGPGRDYWIKGNP